MPGGGGTIIKYAKGSEALGNAFGTQIATPAFKNLRVTGDNLRRNWTSVESAELTASYDLAGSRRVGYEAGGGIPMEFVYGNMDDLLESLFFSTWQTTPQRFNSASDTEIAEVVASTGVITILAAAAGNPNRAGTFAVGHLVKGSAFTAAGNAFSTRRVTAASGTSLTVPITGLVDEAAPPAAARIKAVGFEAPAAAGLTVAVTGLGTGEVAIITGVGLDFVALGVVPGMWIKGAAFAVTGNNGWFRVLNVTTTRIGVDRAPPFVAADTSVGVSARFYVPDYLRNATAALTWFDFERQLPQLTIPEYWYFLSQVPSTWTLRLTPKAILTCTMDFVGSRGTSGTARVASPTDPTVDALGAIPRVGDMFDTSSNVAEVKQGNTRLVDVITDLTITIANGVNGKNVIGNLGFGRVTRTKFRPTVALTEYYEDRNNMLANLEADTSIGISTVLTDPLGTRAFVIDFPTTKVQTGDVEGIAVEEELTSPFTLAAWKDPAGFGFSAQLMRFEEYT